MKKQIQVKKQNVALKTLKIESVPLGSIKQNSYNPNRQSDFDFELLCRSIVEDGFTDAVLVHKDTNEIVDGEHRWTAMIVLQSLAADGHDLQNNFPVEEIHARRKDRATFLEKVKDQEIQIVRVGMTAEQMKIATLRHNRARGSEDIELTAQVLRDLQTLGALDWAQDSLMLSDEELNRLIEDVDVPEALAGDEFSEAWEPEQRRPGAQIGNAEGVTDETSSGKITSASTFNAAETQQKIEAARNEEERQKIREESKIHRLNMVFSGDEAVLIEEVLGRYPAERIVHLCRVWKTNEFDQKFPQPQR